MTSQLIRLGLSNRLPSPVKAKVECCKSCDLFGCQVKDCLATRIPSLSIMGHHPWPTCSCIGGWGVTPLQRCSWHILQPKSTGWAVKSTLPRAPKLKPYHYFLTAQERIQSAYFKSHWQGIVTLAGVMLWYQREYRCNVRHDMTVDF